MENKFIDEYLTYLVEDKWECEFRSYAEEYNVPIIRRASQKFVEMLIMLKKPKTVLEIGTAIGFSSIVMYRQMLSYVDMPRIITIENYDKRIEVAKKNIQAYRGIELLEGDAFEVIQTLDEKFDLIFLDGPKGQYPIYLKKLLELLSEDGIIIIDNVLQDGDVAKSRYEISRRGRTIHKRMREFLYDITHRDDIQTSIIPVDDGMAIVRLR